MRLEELNDKSLFKILKIIYNDTDELDDIYDSDYYDTIYDSDYYDTNDTVKKIKSLLKNLAIKDEFLNIQYIYLCLKNNWSLLDSDTLSSSLNRPQLKRYNVDIDVKVYRTCTESYSHVISSYDDKDSINQIIDYMSNNDNFYPTDGDYNGDDCDYSETEGWEVARVSTKS